MNRAAKEVLPPEIVLPGVLTGEAVVFEPGKRDQGFQLPEKNTRVY